MNRMLITVGFLALAVAAAGCSSDSGPGYAKWDVGLQVKGEATERIESKGMKDDEVNGTYESKGTMESGTFAGHSIGTRYSVAEFKTVENMTVVGETYTENPLVPGEPKFSAVPVAIVEMVREKSGITTTIESSAEERPKDQLHVVEATTVAHSDRETDASTFGLAGDEFVIKISNLDLLWDPNLDEKWHLTRTGIAGIEALVMTDLAVDDFWVSQDGNTLYKAVAKESLLVGGTNVAAVKVELRKVEKVQEGLVAKCLVVPNDDTASLSTTEGPSGAGEGETSLRKVHMDPGCAGKFAHYQTGFQSWSDNILVYEDTTTFDMTINDWGWEWVQVSEGNRSRRTARELDPSNVPSDARLFIEYTYTTTKRTYNVTEISTGFTPWAN